MALCCGSSPRKAAARAAESGGGGFDDVPPPPVMAPRAEQLPSNRELEERYELLEVRGSGKFAQVRRALARSQEQGDGKPPQELALKLIDKHVAHRDESNAAREVEIALSVTHPNIVRSFCALETPQHVVLCMELVGGVDAFEHYSAQSQRPGGPRQAAEAEVALHCRDIMQGLAYLHAQGIAHRDLKLENVMITEAGRAVVVDFGCARRAGPGGGSGGGGGVMETMCGTLEYAAPELLREVPYGVGCDIWSLGVIVYILLSGGDRPFWDDNQKKMIKMVTTDDDGDDDDTGRSKSSHKYRHSYRDASWSTRSLTCRGFIDSCLTKDPIKRPHAPQLLEHAWMERAGPPRPTPATPAAAAAAAAAAVVVVVVPEAEPPSHSQLPLPPQLGAPRADNIIGAAAGAAAEKEEEDGLLLASALQEAARNRQERQERGGVGVVVAANANAIAMAMSDSDAEQLLLVEQQHQRGVAARRRFRLAGHTIGAMVRWRHWSTSGSGSGSGNSLERGESPSLRRELAGSPPPPPAPPASS